MTKQAKLVHEQCDVATVDLSDNITTVFDGPCVLYGVYVDTVLSGEVCPIQDGTQVVRINICLQSEDFSTTWTNNQSSESINVSGITAPDGTETADGLIADTNPTAHYVLQVLSLSNDTDHAHSVFARSADKNWVVIRTLDKAGVTQATYFDLLNGLVGARDDSGTGAIQSLGGGWYRCSIIEGSSSGATSPEIQVWIAEANNDVTFTGDDSTIGIYVWGAQVEAFSSVTDYIPTTDTIRGADYPVVVLPATSAAGTNIDLPGIRLSSLVVNPDDSATGDITVSYRRVNPN